ncbi:MAG: hypothetical protein F9K40_23015 [Kofleriaceae bacterium]|nr:MAG: hypothetical protein F9K40_23015 [Kofleriaceae bacterium]
MSEYNVITFDDDERNARPTMIDNRRPSLTSVGVGRRPVQGLVVPPSTRPTVIQTSGAGMGRPYYPAPQPTVVYHQPAQASALLGLSTAELIELGALALAVLQPLPAAPTGQGDVETDVENLVIYQTALANHAKRDEQLRALGTVIARLVRK